MNEGLKLAAIDMVIEIALALGVSRGLASVSFSISAMGSGAKLLGDSA